MLSRYRIAMTRTSHRSTIPGLRHPLTNSMTKPIPTMMVFSSCKSLASPSLPPPPLYAVVPEAASPFRNEPKSARRPLRRLHPQIPRTAASADRPGGSGEKDTHALVQAFSTLSSLTTLTDSDTENNLRAAADPAPSTASPTHLPLRPSANVPAAATPKTPRNAAKPKYTPAKTPRTSKKALAQAEQAERAAYAQSLFNELNRTVFAGGLPAETSLIWSNRLLTTAGRARWHR
jgi:hypothetical protein